MGRACSTNGERGGGERKISYTLLVGKPERRPLGRQGHRLVNNIKMNLQVPLYAGKFLSSITAGFLLSSARLH
jgi:hypothetical protein